MLLRRGIMTNRYIQSLLSSRKMLMNKKEIVFLALSLFLF
jgi:hypothetical protein